MEQEFNMTELNRTKQKFLGERGFVGFIAFLGAFIPLSTDIYLPAMPGMVANLNTTISLVNLTLVLFFVFYAIGTLFWGPLSDKYGRKPVLLVGLGIYLVSSVLCAAAWNVYVLIAFRIFQAIGCGAATAVSTAMIKDTFEGAKRVKILAIVQTMATTSPIVSPVIGAFILSAVSWRGAFIFLALIGALSVLGALVMQETNNSKSQEKIFKTIGRLGVVAKNKAFMSLLLMFSLLNVAFMSFITASSFIYVDGFGVSEQMYSYYFSANAVFLLLGPMVYLFLARFISTKNLIKIAYSIIVLSGIMVVTIGTKSPLLFCLALIPASLAGNMIGPPRTNLMIEQVDGDTGAASSLINGVFTIFGSFGMLLISFNFVDKIFLMGIMYILAGTITLAAWIILARKSYIRQN